MIKIQNFPIRSFSGRRAIQHEIPSTPLTQTDLSVVSNNSYQQAQNPSMTTYANVLQIANGNRTRIMAEPSTNSLLFANDKVKSNVPLSIRPSRVNLTAATNNLTSAYLSSQQIQRNPPNIVKSRPQLERIVTNRGEILRFQFDRFCHVFLLFSFQINSIIPIRSPIVHQKF